MHQPNNSPQADNQVLLVIMDIMGSEILRVCTNEYMVTDGNGAVRIYKNRVAIQLVDGSLWHPEMTYDLAVCNLCRRSRYDWLGRSLTRHGLLRHSELRHCTACGQGTCHMDRRTLADGRVLCTDCASGSFSLTGILRSVFFHRVGG